MMEQAANQQEGRFADKIHVAGALKKRWHDSTSCHRLCYYQFGYYFYLKGLLNF